MTAISGLPEWVDVLRPQQVTAIAEILDGFRRGVNVMILDGPTGTGKTLVGRVVGQRLGVTSTYVAHSLSLQDQFLADFPEARVLKGRANYPTELRSDLTAADCVKGACPYCDTACPYLVAKNRALAAEVAVLNTAYFLTYPSEQFVRDLVVIDEADTLEDLILGRVEVGIAPRRLSELGLESPLKGAHTKTIRRWVEGELLPVVQARHKTLTAELSELGEDADPKLVRDADRAGKLARSVRRLNTDLQRDRPWIREYSGGFAMKPVTVGEQGADLVWSRGKGTRWLAMSASIIDPETWADDVGVTAAGLRWEVVSLPNLWPRANRPIVTRTFGDMSKGAPEDGKRNVIERVVEICREHQDHGEAVLVHAVSYWLSGEITSELIRAGIVAWTYENAKQRDAALRMFKAVGGVIVAPSLDRGVDLPDDLCRAQVIAKVPFPNLGDRRVAARLHMGDGERWYATHTARTLLQMTGRGIRHKNDRAVTYILDSAYDRFYRQWSRLLPRWWRDSVVGALPTDWWTR